MELRRVRGTESGTVRKTDREVSGSVQGEWSQFTTST
jgi:hypothetical protein